MSPKPPTGRLEAGAVCFKLPRSVKAETPFNRPGRVSLKTPLSPWDHPSRGHTCARARQELPQHFPTSWSPVVTAGMREISEEPTGGWEGDGRGLCLLVCFPY